MCVCVCVCVCVFTPLAINNKKNKKKIKKNNYLLLCTPAKRLRRKACRFEIKCGDTLQRDFCRAGQSQSRARHRQPMGSESRRSQRPLHTYITFGQAAHKEHHRRCERVTFLSVSTNLLRNQVNSFFHPLNTVTMCISLCNKTSCVFFSQSKRCCT